MITRSVVAVTLVAALLASAPSLWAEALKRWDFEEDQEGSEPVGFAFAKTGEGRAGRWVVQAAPQAPSGHHVLAQLEADETDYRFPIALAEEPKLQDVRVSVRCKMVSGRVDQVCGIVLRYQDDENYYVARANALEGNIRFYRVAGGRRNLVEGWNGAVTGGVWHALAVEARNDHIDVMWDGVKVIEADDPVFHERGRVGLWTKADSVTWFDDLVVEAPGS